MSSQDPVKVAERFVEAYNSGDRDALLALCAEDIHVEHHNRGVDLNDRDAFGDIIKGFEAAFPDKHFENRRALHSDGDTVVVEHTWVGTAQADVPGFATAGEVARIDLCSRYTVRDGLVVEYHDYG
ncbi:nuclear transport factor 2 family protein [Amycolatopsis echigonensis]|uniref:Nuclear transport factor 2 family protein n=1 Tax=Amycolatopsis echigonensis TaxID=2576905 RepID=A0A2N3WPI4_9PSEU|nr:MULTISPECIES: nuclear transport factor 2 family protein [Amycolatopsis]MBB2502025.1 nuclear transport factor 2 family protein [Amycolatopsis echigonensis]PKV95770.1 steroid delta-isomerase-like uncharacterized protein [Amycolatopsis niigatensis]